jgi:hypothetical protein
LNLLSTLSLSLGQIPQASNDFRIVSDLNEDIQAS